MMGQEAQCRVCDACREVTVSNYNSWEEISLVFEENGFV
jgi:hypothetical protein